MAVRVSCVLVATLAVAAAAVDSVDNPGLRVALRVFDECSSKSDGFTPCLKRKALTFLDRLGRMEKLAVTDEITIVQSSPTPANATALNEDEIEKSLPRDLKARDQALTDMLWDKMTSVVRSKNIELSMPRLSDIGLEEGRKGSIGGKGGKGGKKGGGLLMGMMMGMMGKMMGLIPLGIAGLFLLAGKALITSKIALLLSGIIALKKLVAAKNSHGGHGHGHGHGGAHHVWATGGGGGGGWDKRSLEDAQKLAYNSYSPKQ